MPKHDLSAWTRASIGLLTAAAFVFGGLTGLAALPLITISQKGRQFKPPEVSIKRGEAIDVVNDDADLLHHAYVDSDTFRFDSGDQKPGSKTSITFPVTGTFEVLCAIHPKMKLIVHVQ